MSQKRKLTIKLYSTLISLKIKSNLQINKLYVHFTNLVFKYSFKVLLYHGRIHETINQGINAGYK